MRLRPFELILVTGFAIMAVLAVALLALYSPAPDDGGVAIAGPVKIWGVLPKEPIATLLDELSRTTPAFQQVTYEYIDPANFNQAFITALADRTAPDLVLLPHTELVAQRNRLQPLSYENFSIRDFRDRYIDGTEIFALRDGIYALPIAIDPLVLYWNRDQVLNAGFLSAPATWEHLVNEMVPKLTEREFDRTIRRAALAMGEYENVRHALPILSMLTIQAGSRLITESETAYELRFNEGASGNEPFTQALEFYMRFSNPQNQLYTWNRSLASDRELFNREELTFYFGFGSEAYGLAQYNPNLNFDIAEMPQGAASTLRRTYANFYGLAVVRNSANMNSAYTVLSTLLTEEYASRMATGWRMAPASRAGLLAGTSDVYGTILYSSAPVARAWLSPRPEAVEAVFAAAIREAGADRANVRSAASSAMARLRLEY